MRRFTTLLALAAAAAPLAVAACATVQRAENAAGRALIPVDQEKQLGQQMQPEVEKGLKMLNDPAVTGYVSQLGQRIAKAANNPDKWQFTFHVVDDPKTVNAFAIPGGTIYVYTGLLNLVKDEAELGGVLAHEISHVTQRHFAGRLVATYGLQTVAGLALGQDPSLLQQIAASIALQGALLQNSRQDETDADLTGVVTLAHAGYDPQAMPDFFRTLQASQGNLPGVLQFLSDHPNPGDRVQALEARIRDQHLSGTQRNPAPVQAMQQQLKQHGGTAPAVAPASAPAATPKTR